MTKGEITILADKILNGTASDQEIALYNSVFASFQQAEGNWNEQLMGNRDDIEAELKESILLKTGLQRKQQPINWIKWASVAAVLTGFIISGYYIFFNRTTEKSIIQDKEIANEIGQDILPGGNRATLTLADGSTIILDQKANGDIAQQGNSKIVKVDSGQLAYNINSYVTVSVPQYNVISTPRGGTYKIVLPDGSKVWLNAASSLQFPIAFNGKERTVQLTGEGYFEIAKDKSRPFKVIANDITTEVLGTRFDINAYADESITQATLFEGSVKVIHHKKSTLLKPGQQFQSGKDGSSKVLSDADTDGIAAWKDGYFQFENVPIETIMRQVARWYDVEITYRGTINKKFSVLQLPRHVTASRIFSILELTGHVHFDIDNKKVTVTQGDNK